MTDDPQAEIKALRAQLRRFQEEMSFVIGFNDGFQEGVGRLGEVLQFPQSKRQWSTPEIQVWIDHTIDMFLRTEGTLLGEERQNGHADP